MEPIARKVLVIGLDGATFRVLRPLAERGLLPNLARLMAEGTSGTLLSTIPPVTAPAWSSFMTGVNPGAHGLFNWQKPWRKGEGRQWVTGRDIRAPKIWQLLGSQGKRVGIINLPLTYPPEPVNGFMISGLLTPKKQGKFTYPPDLQTKVEKISEGYILDVDIMEGDRHLTTLSGMNRLLDELDQATQKRTQVALALAEEYQPDVLILVYEAPDRIQHGLWRYSAESHPSAASGEEQAKYQRVAETFRRLDESLGQLLSWADDETAVFVVSDHGFAPLRGIFYLNGWLAERGFLHYRPLPFSLRRRAKPILDGVRRFIPPSLLQRGRRLFSPQSAIDWSRTQAYAGLPTENGIYINLQGREPQGMVSTQERDSLRTAIARQLVSIVDPASREPIVRKVYLGEEVYHGPYVQDTPDIVFELNPGYKASPLPSPTGQLEDASSLGRGFHDREGILIAWGAGINPGNELLEASISILDIAPTLFFALGLPVPQHMEGRVLRELFTPQVLEGRKMEYANYAPLGVEIPLPVAYDEAEARDIEEKLRGLGYLG